MILMIRQANLQTAEPLSGTLGRVFVYPKDLLLYLRKKKDTLTKIWKKETLKIIIKIYKISQCVYYKNLTERS